MHAVLAPFHALLVPLDTQEQGKNGTPALDTARRDALRLYERALALEPTNAMAAHGRNALLRDLTTAQVGLNGDAHTDAASADPARSGLAAGYVRELFDSYAFAFDASLFALNYQSHLLVGEVRARAPCFTLLVCVRVSLT